MGRSRPKRVEIEPAQLLAFAALVRSGGVRAAATALGVPRSTVSRRLQQLEAAVGAPLTVRGARQLTLTEVGRELAERGEALATLLADSADVVTRMQDEPAGVLRIDAAPVLADEVLPEVIAELAAKFPRLAIEVRTDVGYIDLRNGTADVVLRARRLDDADNVFATKLGTSVTGCYASPAYLEKRGVPAKPADLSRHDCLVVGPRQPATWAFANGEDEITMTIHGRVRVESFRLARSLAALDAGIVRTATAFAAPLVVAGELVPVLEKYWTRTPLYAAHIGKASPKLRAFLALVKDAVARALPEDGSGRWA